MDGRFQSLLERGQRKIEPSGEFGLHVVVIDELAFFLRGGKKESREKFSELLRDLISRGRAAGIIVVAATQNPNVDSRSLRVSTRVALQFIGRLRHHSGSGLGAPGIFGDHNRSESTGRGLSLGRRWHSRSAQDTVSQ
jgi:SRSO17 transposase